MTSPEPPPTATSQPAPKWYLPLLAVSLFLLWVVRPFPVWVEVGERQQVETTIPILGVHTRLTDEVETWKIQQSLSLVREMGAPWIVEFFPWAYSQPGPEVYNWGHADDVIDHAEAQGLRVIARLGLVPDWARPDDTPLNYLAEDSYDDFADFAAAFAARYKGRVDHIIVLNEPNLTFEWGGRQTEPADYVALLRAVYPLIKQANPQAVVLAGALAPTLEPEGSPNGLNDLLYLQGMYDAGGAAYFDALAVHSYGLTFPPEAEPGSDLLNFRRVELVREIMESEGDFRPIFITEAGWNDHPRWTKAVRPAQRISYSLDAISYAQTHWPYVEVLAFWLFRTPAPTHNFLDYYSFVTPEFVQKPIYHQMQERARKGDPK